MGAGQKNKEEEQKCLGNTKAPDRVGGLWGWDETRRDKKKAGTDKTQYSITQYK